MQFSALYEDIERVINFFFRTPDSGLLFCSTEQPWLAHDVSRQVSARIDYLNGHRLCLLELDLDDKRPAIEQIRQAVGNSAYYGLIILNCDQAIEKQGARLVRELDGVCDELMALGLPIVVWLNRNHLSFFAQEAPRLWLRRSSNGVYFTPPEELRELHRNEEATRLALRAALLTRRLQAGEAAGRDEAQMAREVVGELIEVHLDQGDTQAAVQLFQHYKAALALIPGTQLLRQRLESLAGVTHGEKGYDVFISYAHEDRKEAAEPLAQKLKKAGLEVWFEGFEIKEGDSLTQSINRGLANARYGVVIVSPNYLNKSWTLAEFNALFARKTASGKKIVLPVWHKLSYQEVLARHPLLADKYAVTTEDGLSQVVEKIIDVAKAAEKDRVDPKNAPHLDQKAAPPSEVELIQELISEDKLGDALAETTSLARKENPDLLDELIMQSARWHSLRRELENGLILRSDAEVTKNRIRDALVKLLLQLH